MNHEHRVFKRFSPSKKVFPALLSVIDLELLEEFVGCIVCMYCPPPHDRAGVSLRA